MKAKTKSVRKPKAAIAALWVIKPIEDAALSQFRDGVRVVQTSFNPERWAIKTTEGMCLSKSKKTFNLEPMSSGRTDEYYDDTRWPSSKKAVEFAMSLIPHWQSREDQVRSWAGKGSLFGDVK